MPIPNGRVLNLNTVMETTITIISIIASSLFAGTTIFQFFSLRSMKKKLKAEANKASAEADQEEAKVDGLNLENIRTLLNLQGEQLTASEQRNVALSRINDEMRAKMEGYDEDLADMKDQIRQMKEKLSQTLNRAEYAEENLCLDKECDIRQPKLGTFKPLRKES